MKINKKKYASLRKEEIEQLDDAICKITKKDEAKTFLRDLFTYREHQEISRRLEIAVMIEEGFTHHEISDILGVGVATVSRVNAKLKSGIGFKSVIDKLEKRISKVTKVEEAPDTSDSLERYLNWRLKKGK